MEQYGRPGIHGTNQPPRWLWALSVFSCGLLAVVPPLVIASKLRQPRVWRIAGAVTAAWFLGFALVASQPDGADNVVTTSGVLLYLAAWVGGVIFALAVGPKVDWSPRTSTTTQAYDPNPAAIAAIMAGRRKREDARDLARRDPQMARDLRVGRPDLARQYDDGGLVDVNSAPAEALTRWLGLSPPQAAQLVEARQQLGRFENPDDLMNLAGMEPSTYDRVKDQVILL